MSIIVEFELASTAFELGRVLAHADRSTIELDSLVPIAGTNTPFVWIVGPDHEAVEETLATHPTVTTVEQVDEFEDRSLYALDWMVEYDHLFRYFRDHGIQILAAGATNGIWTFTLRFQTHHALSAFQAYIEAAQIGVDVSSVTNLRGEDQTTFFGLTDAQRETLITAVREGYYDIPREASTSDLGDRFEISDQAVTERLPRAIAALVQNTLMIDGYHRTRR
jgi:predicted DNA binding protein